MGKGGVGKTTIAMLLLEAAARRGMRALGVDADAQRSLTLVAMGHTRASLYQRLANDGRQRRAGGVAREDYDTALAQSLTTTPQGFDLITMGRPTGEGCYCAANTAVKKLVFGEVEGGGALAARYDLVVVDCEAGPEKVARRMLTPGSTALIVAMPDQRGMSIQVGGDIAAVISEELPQVRIRRLLNQVPQGFDQAALPPPWPAAVPLPDTLAELTRAAAGLFDQLLSKEEGQHDFNADYCL